MGKAYPITKIEQFKALTSSLRGEIVDIVNLMGPLSIFEIADYTGRPADSLYYHVKKLVSVGLLNQVDKRKSDRQMEQVFDVRGRPMFLRYKPSQTKHIEYVIKSIATMLRATWRNFKRAFDKSLIRASRGDRNFDHILALGWYTDEEIQEIRFRIRQIVEGFHSSAKKRKKTSGLFSLTVMLVPLEVKRRGKHEQRL